MKYWITSLLFLLIATSAPAEDDAATDGARHVHNGNEPAHESVRVDPVEIWRCGGDEDSEVFFGLVSDVVVDDDGLFYVLDTKLSDVKVLSPSGEYLRTIGRSGDGPGEFRSALSLVILPDASIGVAQSFPSKLIGLLPGGDPRPNIDVESGTTGQMLAMKRVLRGGPNLVVSIFQTEINEEAQNVVIDSRLQQLALDGSLGHIYYRQEVTLTPGKPFFERDFARLECPFDVSPEGRVVVAPRPDQYLFEIHDPDNGSTLVVHKPNENWKRTERAQYFVMNDMRLIGQGMGVLDIRLEEEEQEILDLQWRQDGTIWVRTGRASYEHAPGEFRYDVFTADGKFDRTVHLFVEGDANLDLLKFVGDDRVLLIRGFRDALHGMAGIKRPWMEDEAASEPGVICYRFEI